MFSNWFVSCLLFPTVSVAVVRFSSVTSRSRSSSAFFLRIGDDGQLMSVLWLSTDAVQLAIPIGDDGQLMSGGSGARPVLWLSTDAVQLAPPIGDDGQLMS